MSHDLKQSFTMVLGFIIGLSVAFIFMPSNLALAMTSGIICGLLAGAFLLKSTTAMFLARRPFGRFRRKRKKTVGKTENFGYNRPTNADHNRKPAG